MKCSAEMEAKSWVSGWLRDNVFFPKLADSINHQ